MVKPNKKIIANSNNNVSGTTSGPAVPSVKIDHKQAIPVKKGVKRRFRLNARNIFLTYPRFKGDKAKVLAQLKAKRAGAIYAIVANEKHEDGTPHTHAVVSYEKPIDTENPHCYDIQDDEGVIHHGDYQGARNLVQSVTYCKKDGDFLEDGTAPVIDQAELQKRAYMNKVKLEKTCKQLVDEGIIPLEQVAKMQASKSIYNLLSIEDKVNIPRVCLWIYGSSGQGKSYIVRNMFPKIFTKSQNKWWDTYNGEAVVLIDDMDLQAKHMGHNLKIWADDYSFNAEIKGGTVRPSYNVLIVTSQYTPKEIWCEGSSQHQQDKWDPLLAEAIERRFMMVYLSGKGPEQRMHCKSEAHSENKWFGKIKEHHVVYPLDILQDKMQDFNNLPVNSYVVQQRLKAEQLLARPTFNI